MNHCKHMLMFAFNLLLYLYSIWISAAFPQFHIIETKSSWSWSSPEESEKKTYKLSPFWIWYHSDSEKVMSVNTAIFHLKSELPSLSPLCVVHKIIYLYRFGALWNPQGPGGPTNWQEDVWDKAPVLPFDWCVISGFSDSPHLTVIISIQTGNCVWEIRLPGGFRCVCVCVSLSLSLWLSASFSLSVCGGRCSH